MQEANVASRDTSAKQLMSALSRVLTRGPDGWGVRFQPICVDDCAPLDYRMKFEHVPRDESRASFHDRHRITVAPAWARHPYYGEPEEFLGYTVEQSKSSEEDFETYAEYLTFKQALDCLDVIVNRKWESQLSRDVRNWREDRKYEDYKDLDTASRRVVDEYEGLSEITEDAVRAFVDHFNDVKRDAWDEMAVEDVTQQELDMVLGTALREEMVDFVDVKRLALVAEHQLPEAEQEIEA